MARSPLIGTSTQAAEANYDQGNKRERGAEGRREGRSEGSRAGGEQGGRVLREGRREGV
jgi:hypothetical protein